MTDLLPIATAPRTRAALRVLVRPHRARLAGALALLVAGTAAGLVTPPLLGRIVDLATSGGSVTAIVVTGAGLVAAAVIEAGLAGLGVALLAQVGEGMLARLRERFVESALRLPLEQVERAGAGDLTSRVTNDVAVIAEATRSALPEFTRALLTIGLTLAGLAVLDWRFLVAALIAVPVQAYTVRWYARRAVPLYARQRVAVAAQQHHLLSTIDGAPTIRAFRLAGEHGELVASRSQQAVDLLLRGIALQTRFYARLHVAEFLGLAAVLATGFFLVRGDSVSLGTATAAALYFHGLFGPINVALALVDDAQAAASGLDRLVGVADLDPADEPPAERRDDVAHAVVVSGLDFSYRAGRPVLHGIDLTIARGERVAVVGSSGAGKTTLAKVIAGVHQPTAGTVTVPAGEVALITQEVHVFAGTLADDLRLARPDATDDEVRAALTAVDALDWVEQLPDGVETEVGSGGHVLTAAQAQQLAFARLILADPPVAILDEATAEAGSAGARLLERVASAALRGRTAVIVAHRLTQAMTADRVVVLQDGRIAEIGSHAELITRDGPYAVLWQAWSDQRAQH
ncbi:ABC transporter ATP-binding protein [Actinoplanes friuliensis]|uniref:Multidrug ABC transporter ATPase/permease-like protein n=1 Tax=Actinoplanes friuliensis DSM 7358 TaxID=1246995 RepID=U5W4X6_9ACTN|nr:ABC transporter ATP-binding protein [Actinoplanes friuliensis]AGZ42996.1 multidrug ABC transporter ATPase/permease-like protein [Actinoplanes friuliensis DSM 7358]